MILESQRKFADKSEQFQLRNAFEIDNSFQSRTVRTALLGRREGEAELTVPRSQYPIWVKLSIWGVPGRGGLWGFVVACVVLALICSCLALVEPFFRLAWIVGIPTSLAGALVYWGSIWWIDRYGSWEKE